MQLREMIPYSAVAIAALAASTPIMIHEEGHKQHSTTGRTTSSDGMGTWAPSLALIARQETVLKLIAISQTPKVVHHEQNRQVVVHYTGGSGFPGDCIARHESGGSYSAYNPSPAANGNASGKYQVTSGTWNGYGGYSSAMAAPPSVQEAQARSLWARNPNAWNGTGCPGTG